MRVAHHVVRGHLLREDQLRDGKRIKGRGGRGVVGSLCGRAWVVVNRGERLEHQRWRLGSEVVLHLPL